MRSAYDIFPHAFRRDELLFLWAAAAAAAAAADDDEPTGEERRGTCCCGSWGFECWCCWCCCWCGCWCCCCCGGCLWTQFSWHWKSVHRMTGFCSVKSSVSSNRLRLFMYSVLPAGSCFTDGTGEDVLESPGLMNSGRGKGQVHDRGRDRGSKSGSISTRCGCAASAMVERWRSQVL